MLTRRHPGPPPALTPISPLDTVRAMKRWIIRVAIGFVCLAALPYRSPAPLIFRQGEGWTYERAGESSGKWTRTRAKDQLQVAQEAFDKNDHSLALKAARRTVNVWPLSDYAPQAQYLLARSYEIKGEDERAFRAYQTLLEKYPKVANYEEVLQRQYAIASRFLDGQWFKLWGYIPFFPSMDKTSGMYSNIIKHGVYSGVAAQAQLGIGAAREKKSEYVEAVKAYEKAADRYYDQSQIAADALYKTAQAYAKQAKTAEYDQNTATKAIEAFTSFAAQYPQDPRGAEVEKAVANLKTEQARGAYQVAQFYEKRGQWNGALVYYNEVLLRDASSPLAEEARQRIHNLRQRTAPAKPPASP